MAEEKARQMPPMGGPGRRGGMVGKPDVKINKETVKRLIEEKIGKTVEIEVRHVEEGRRFEESFVDIEKLVHMDLTIED